MATIAHLSPAEYLRTSFPDLDKEYVRGEIVERSMPDEVHSAIQSEIIGRFHDARKRGLPCWVRPELRLQLARDVFRIPDISIFDSKPAKLVPDTPPLVAIEIISKDDRYTNVLEKLEEYCQFGVPNIWLIDPWLRRLSVYDEAGLHTVEELLLERFGIAIRIDELLSSIE